MGQTVGGLVPAGAVLLQTLHHDPVQISAHHMNQLRRLGMTSLATVVW